MQQTSSTITIRALTKRFDGPDVTANAVDDISFDIADGTLVTLLGASGCGKTTTMRMIAGLETPTSGEISIDGAFMYADGGRVNVPVSKRPIGIVFQSYAIWPHMSVFENVAYPLRVRRPRMSKAEVRERTEESLEAVGLAKFSKRPGTALSGGQQQRAALARALIKEPKVLLLDEPLSNLDAKLRDRMREWIREVQQRSGITTICVTHDQEEALGISDRVLLMEDGRIVDSGVPEDIYRRPTSKSAAQFIGIANHVSAVVRDVGSVSALVLDTEHGPLSCSAPAGYSTGEALTVYLRPEDLRLGRAVGDDVAWRGVVRSRVFVGPCWEYYVTMGATDLRVRLYGDAETFEVGDAVHVWPDGSKAIVVRDEEGASIETLAPVAALDD
ncbi:MAG TPA: ABC transporter ATP-binding protein [Solirubrobacteraceae bacterium]|nr:ABC transporter ATP-binding protein [Solirubrobacteraceae bacterium]